MTYDRINTSKLAELIEGELRSAAADYHRIAGQTAAQGEMLVLTDGRGQFDVVAGRDQHGNLYAQVQWSTAAVSDPAQDWALLFTSPTHVLDEGVGVRLRKPYTTKGLPVLLSDVRLILASLPDSPDAP